MSIWGKIAGVAAGYAIGGVPGAVFGALAGHFVLDRINDRQVIFTIALISLAAKMTRADGIVSPIEVQAVQSVLRVPETEHANMVRVFRLAQEDVAGFDTYAR
ncbi:MAG: TerB family tellurite resistance protein, partial [Pseudomonadota bacterium]|nr:TerB family tellurite resistance protein [Pseudomonadota bacterium]